MSDSERRKRDFAAGYLVGLAGMPLAITPAVASDPLYLYGGVPLPPLPAEWDRETYPYAVIIKHKQDNKYRLICYKSLSYFDSQGKTWFGTTKSGTAIVFTSLAAESSWINSGSTYWSFEASRNSDRTVAIWTHGFDLMCSDGSLYVAASAPGRITDWESLRGQYFYNDFIGPAFGNFDLPDEHARYIIKTETKYLFLSCVSALGGAFLVCDGDNIYIYNGEWDYIISASSRDIDGGEWQNDSQRNYLGEEYEVYGAKYHYICSKNDVIWSEDNIGTIGNDSVAFYGSERVPVPEPPEVTIDNKAIMLGCRLGYIIRSQMGKGQVEIPDGVLISSDGYILCDCNGVYLIAKEDA